LTLETPTVRYIKLTESLQEFKARGIKKRPIDITISVDGVKVVLQRKKKQQKDGSGWDESKLLVMFHPIYRQCSPIGHLRPTLSVNST